MTIFRAFRIFLLLIIFCSVSLHAHAAPDGYSCPSIDDANPSADGTFNSSPNGLNTGAVATCITGTGVAVIPVQFPVSANVLAVNNQINGGLNAVFVRLGSNAINVTVNGSPFIQHPEPNSPGFTTLQFNGGVAATINATIQFDVGGNTFHFVLNKAPGTVVDGFTIIAGPDPNAPNNSVNQTQQLISSFLQNRANNILGSQPDLISHLDGSNGQNVQPGSLSVDGNEQAFEVAFATSHSQIRSYLVQKQTDQAFSKDDDLLNVVPSNQLPTTKRAGTWDFWTRIHGAHSDSGSADQNFWIGYVGAHYFVTEQMLVGVLGQFDRASQDNSSSSISGNGWMVGPYMAGRFEGSNLYYEARASWGQSVNEVSPLGTYTDSFDTTRWLLSAKLKGDLQIGDVNIRPQIRISYFEETQEAYTDSTNSRISQQTISLGELNFGPQITRTIKFENDTVLTPKLAISGIWNFAADNGNGNNALFSSSSVRARINGGFNLLNAAGWHLEMAGFYDGIGISNYDAYGGSIRLVIPLN